MSYLYEVAGPTAEPEAAWPRSERELERLRGGLLPLLASGLDEACRVASVPSVDPEPLLQDFLELYADRPVASNRGGSGFNDSLWLFLLVRALNPPLIIESGTWHGHSAWLLRHACPAAVVHSFDLEVPAGGRYEDPDVVYHLEDWAEHRLDLPNGGEPLVFFDDHISHARRLQEAADRGIKLALLDDNFPAHQLHATGAPPVPTLAMLSDRDLPAGSVIEWQRNGKHYRYMDTAERRMATLRLIEAQVTLPELAAVTRHSPGSGLTLVRLKN